MKKTFALVLALVMIFAMAVPTMAAEALSHTITIVNQHNGYTYKAYQIFAGDLGHDGVLSNITWGSGIDGDAFLAELQKLDDFKDCTDAKQVAAELADNSAMDDPDAMAFADLAAQFLTTPSATSSYDSATAHYYIKGLEDGYYMVVNTDVPDAENTLFSRHILEVVRDITVTHKGTFPSVVKNIIEPELVLDVNQKAIGASETYRITGTLPDSIATYVTYYYAFHDTLSKGLTYNNDMTITVNGVDVTEYFYIEATEYSETDGTYIYAGIQDIKALANETDANGDTLNVGAITKDTQVIVTYTAEVNENAVIASTGNPNKVYLEYDNNPNTEGDPTPPSPNPDKPTPPDPTGKTPEDEVRTYVTELTILKKDGAGDALQGAEFTLTGESVKTMIVTRQEFVVAGDGETPIYWELNDGTFTDVAPVFDDPETEDKNEDTSHGYVNPGTSDAPAAATHVLKEIEEIIEKAENVDVKGFVGSDGYLTFTGLGAGTYTLTESVTPTGFNTIDPITFTVIFDHKTGKFDETSNNLIMVENDNTLYAEIINVAGTVLPSTGGVGTTLFYVFGGLLFAGAAILLITKKRMAY